MSGFARTEIGALRVSHGDLESGCEELAEQVDIWYHAGEWAQQWHTLMRCVITLDRIRQPAVAAEVLGSIEAHSAVGAPPLMVTLRDLVLERVTRSCRTSVPIRSKRAVPPERAHARGHHRRAHSPRPSRSSGRHLTRHTVPGPT